MRIRILAEAEQEGLETAAWYDQRQPGLGGEFLDELDRVIRRIRESPLSLPLLETIEAAGPAIRRCALHRFPYIVIFEFDADADELCIAAVSHTSRNPRYWLERLK
ncbi:MAG: type II toxin-antitoxin system RelE/ParE family toxin [Planctomycetes bacterium]|nr:type II toxin-antitoxin system RelE/ParE family toxin [Planctomycetota bacterium]